MDSKLPLLRKALGAASVALAFVIPGTASAAVAQATMAVSATVQSACVVVATPLAFGVYNSTSTTPLDTTATVTVTCTTGTSFNVGLNAGGASGATVTSRQMVQGANVLNYSVYRDSGRTNNWGSTPGVDTSPATVATVVPSILTVYGRIPALQNVPTGAYSDSISVTVTY